METISDARSRAVHLVGVQEIANLEQAGLMVVPTETFRQLQKLLSAGIEYFTAIEGCPPAEGLWGVGLEKEDGKEEAQAS